jgi:hypothetical protein
MDNYKVRITNLTDPENIVFSGWLRSESPFRLIKETSGLFELNVRAFDKAGNFKEAKTQFRIINSNFVLSTNGIQFLGFSFAWWQFYLLLFLLLSLIIFLIFKLMKGRKKEESGIELEKEIQEALKEIEDVKRAQQRLHSLRKKEELAGEQWRKLRGDLKQEIEKKDEDKSF